MAGKAQIKLPSGEILEIVAKDGDDGYTPIKGVDYFDGYTPRKGTDYFDGEDGSPDTPQDIADKLNTLDEKVDFKVLKNVPYVFRQGGQPGGVVGRTFLQLFDTPDSYYGQGGKSVAVNAAGDGLEFVTITTTDEKVKLSAADPTAGYLNDKLSGGTGISYSNGVISISGLTTTDVSEGANLYFTDERAQDAVGAMVDTSLTYVDGTPLLRVNEAYAHTWTGQATFNSAAAIFGVGTVTPKIYPAADSTNAVGVYKADGTTQIAWFDTTNSVVGIKTGGVPASSNVLSLQVGAKSYAGATTSNVYIQAVGGGSTEALTVVENAGFTVANIMSIRGSAGNALWGITSTGGTMSGTWTIAGGGSISTSTAGGASFFGVAHVTSTSPGGYRINATSDGNFGLYNVTQNYNPVLCRDDTDGATAIGVSLTSRAFTTAGAKIVNFLNNTTEKAYIDLNGGFFGLGIITSRLTTTQQQWEYDASNYANVTVGSTGGVTFDAVGSGAAFTFSDALTATQLTSSGLTAGRVTFAGTAGILTDDADFTFATDTLTATKIVGTTSIKVGTAAGYISSDGSTGATGTFTTVDLKTVTVKDGITTSIV